MLRTWFPQEIFLRFLNWVFFFHLYSFAHREKSKKRQRHNKRRKNFHPSLHVSNIAIVSKIFGWSLITVERLEAWTERLVCWIICPFKWTINDYMICMRNKKRSEIHGSGWFSWEEREYWEGGLTCLGGAWEEGALQKIFPSQIFIALLLKNTGPRPLPAFLIFL